MTQFQTVRAVILAGGSGTRLWPLSRLQTPKQFIQVAGDASLLEATIARLHPMIPPSRVLVVTNQETASGEGYRILLPYEKLIEPEARNTAAAIGVAAVRCVIEDADTVMVVLPSDHLIRDVSAFQEALAVAIDSARAGNLVTFGIRPTGPETGFGYIEAARGTGVVPVLSFREKPDRATAEALLESGNCYWNSGIFVWRASAILDAIRGALPELAAVMTAIETEARASGDFQQAVRKHFGRAPSISIDHGVLQRCGNLHVLPAPFDWSDVGSWDAVYDIAEKDDHGNALQGNSVAIDCTNVLIRGQDRLVAAVDVDGVCVIETRDAVLVTRRGETQGVRKIVEELMRRGSPERLTHATVQRPWGSFTILEEGLGFKIKHLQVRPGGRLSLQRHQHRSEHWVVVSGQATVTCEQDVATLGANQSTYIPAGSKHRLENRDPLPLEIIEVQVGTYVGEDDIERFDDAYERPVASPADR